MVFQVLGHSNRMTYQEWQFLSEGTITPGRYNFPLMRQGRGGRREWLTVQLDTHCIVPSSKMGAVGGHLG